jgi:hypothetical protein
MRYSEDGMTHRRFGMSQETDLPHRHSGQGRQIRRLLTATAAVTLSMAALGAAGAPAAFAGPANTAPQRIGTAPKAPAGAAPAAAPAASTVLNLGVELAPRNAAALSGFVTAVSTPGSPEYHQYLSKGQFATEFGPTTATINSVTSALSSAGLTPGKVSADGLSIPVTATIAAAEHALGVGFAGYRMSDGRATYANTAAPELAVPAASVTDILGLNNFVTKAAEHVGEKKVAAATPTTTIHSNTPRSNTATPQVCSQLKTELDGGGLVDGKDYWEPTTLGSAGAYNFSPLYNQYGNTGSGVTIALFELETYSPDDISTYQSCFGTSVPLSNVTVDGGPSAPVDLSTEVGLESDLDIETAIGLAPGASIKVYQGPDAQNATDGDVLDVYRQMVDDDSAQVLSTSWGSCELDIQQSDPGFFAAESTIFQQAAAQGQSLVAASGDSGSTGCYQNPFSTVPSSLSADDPASQPDVTAVGGTSMTLNGATSTQSTWNTPAGGGVHGAASGGGVSAVEQLSGASNYQTGFTGAGYANSCASAAGSTCRQVPDVSALADPNGGYLIAYGVDVSGGWFSIGGTSGAAPLWAALAALADSSTACAANGNVGLLNPALYGHASAMTDVTTGNNNVLDSGYTGGLYAAGAGYDLATGLGTPKAPQVVEALCGTKTAAAGSTFSPLAPVRVLDTRNATGVSTTTPVGPGGLVSLQVTGVNGVPASGVTAVTLNVTVADATLGSFLTVYPDGTARPTASNLNFVAGQTIPTLVTVPVGSDGKVDFYNFHGSVDVIADLFGYYSTGSGSLYQPISPVRVLDTRSPATGVPTAAPVGPGQHISLQMAGSNGVPASGVSAVVLNVTATDATTGSFLTVYPDPADPSALPPTASNLNFVAGDTIPNLVTVPVGADGKVAFYNFHGNVDVVADLFGYYTSSGTGFKFHPSTPHRLVDTRGGIGVAAGQPAPVGGGQTLGLPLTDTNGVGNAGPLGSAAALMLNVTATAPTAGSFVTVYPSGVARGTWSNLNFSPGETIPNAALTPVNGNSIDFYNFHGNVQLVVDVFGYFSAS